MSQVAFSDEIAPARPGQPILRVEDLVKHFSTDRGLLGSDAVVHAVDNVDLEIHPGEVLALVGESGSGKSSLALAVGRLLPPVGEISAGSVTVDGVDVVQLSGKELRRARGRLVGYLAQDSMAALNPVLTAGKQLAEVFEARDGVGRGEARREAVAMLTALAPTRADRIAELRRTGYPAYTTSPGWLGYPDQKMRRLVREAVAGGFRAVKLKVGARLEDDIRRLGIAQALGNQVSPAFQLLAGHIVFLVVLFFRPQGLFARATVRQA